MGRIDTSRRGLTAVAITGHGALASEGSDYTRRRSDLADAFIFIIRNIKVTRGVDRYTSWVEQCCTRGLATISTEVSHTRSSYR